MCSIQEKEGLEAVVKHAELTFKQKRSDTSTFVQPGFMQVIFMKDIKPCVLTTGHH